MKAVKRFDPTVGVALVSFAVHWIRAEIHEYVLRQLGAWVKVPPPIATQAVLQSAQDEKNLAWLSEARKPPRGSRSGVDVADVRDGAAASARDMFSIRPGKRRRGSLLAGLYLPASQCRSGHRRRARGMGRRIQPIA